MKKFSITLAQKEALEKQIAGLTVTAVLSVAAVVVARAADVLTEAKEEAASQSNS